MSSNENEKILDELLEQLKVPMEKYYDGDPMLYVELFADDPNITYFDPSRKSQFVGIDAVRERYEPVVGKVYVPGYEVTTPHLIMSGETAILSYVLSEMAEDGTYMNEWQASEVYEKQDGRWRLLHSQWAIFPKTEEEA